MAEILDGDYQILPAVNAALSLDANGAVDLSTPALYNGANVSTWNRNWGTNQQWTITKVGEKFKILSKFIGKYLDVAGVEPVSGANVQVWTGNDERSQLWDIVETSGTVSVDGVERPVYILKLVTEDSETELALDVTGASSTPGANVEVWTVNGSAAQNWALVPIPAFVSGGVYQIRPMSSLNQALDVNGNGTVNGTNIQAWASNDTNAQKFYITDTGTGYTIRHIGSGKYVDVNGAATETNGTNVQLWEQNDTRAQRWSMTSHGQQYLSGQPCEVVTFGAGNGTSHVLDVAGAGTYDGVNVLIWQAITGAVNQKFALLPTIATDPFMPVPTGLGLASAVGNAGTTTPETGTLYPTWRCSDSWASAGPNSYRWRYRKRYMSTKNQWNDWTEWTAWATAGVTIKGTQAWVNEGIDASYSIDDYKNMEFQFQVQSQGVNETKNVRSDTADQVCQITYRPNVTITASELTHDGLKVSYSSDYPYGAMTIYVEGLSFDGRDVLRSSYSEKVYTKDGSILIPMDKLKSYPTNGTAMSMAYTVGTDQRSYFAGTSLGTTNITWDSGSVELNTTFTDGDWFLDTATVDKANEVRMWLQPTVSDILIELNGTVNGNTTVFDVPYPFGSEYDIFVSYSSSDGTQWGMSHIHRPAKDALYRAHVLTWPGGGFSIWLKKGSPITEERTLAPQFEELMLNQRLHSVNAYSGLVKSTGKFDGVVEVRDFNDPYSGTLANFEKAVERAHCLYRSPWGRMFYIGITNASFVKSFDFATVAINYTEETL